MNTKMPAEIVRTLKPEEEEVLRKRAELAAIRGILAERELELADFKTELAVFEGRYLRQVGKLYAELDECKARISELRARLHPTAESREDAARARDQARQTYQDAHGAASEAKEFVPSPELKSLFREVAKNVHPDLAQDPADLERRTRFMADANRAFSEGDAEALKRIFAEYQEGADSPIGEGIGAELIRLIRQISKAKDRLVEIDREQTVLRQSEIALLREQARQHEVTGRDLLVELAAEVRKQIEVAQREYDGLVKAEVKP